MSDKPTKVLLVDDEPNILVAIEFLMVQNGFLVEMAFDGVEAIEKAKAFLPDIIVLDVMMPEMDGYEVANHLRQDQAFVNTKIIFLTARGTETDRMNGYGKGAEIYLTKPFDNNQLVSVVQELATYG